MHFILLVIVCYVSSFPFRTFYTDKKPKMYIEQTKAELSSQQFRIDKNNMSIISMLSSYSK